jgi:hypothetical protein
VPAIRYNPKVVSELAPEKISTDLHPLKQAGRGKAQCMLLQVRQHCTQERLLINGDNFHQSRCRLPACIQFNEESVIQSLHLGARPSIAVAVIFAVVAI